MKKEKKVRKVLTVWLLSVCMLGQLRTEVLAQSVNDEQNIKKYVEKYFSLLDQSYADLRIPKELGQKFIDKNSLTYVALDTHIKHCKMQISDLRYNNYETKIDFESVEQKADGIYVKVLKTTDMQYKCMEGEKSWEQEEHMLLLKKKSDNSYQIALDKSDNGFQDLLVKENGSLKEREKKILEESQEDVTLRKQEIRQSIKQVNNENDTNKTELKTKMISLYELSSDEDDYEDLDFILPGGEIPLYGAKGSFKLYEYDRVAARTYAYQYVKSPNPAYENFESLKGNCTNFTSQCLKAGGIKQDTTGNYKWYYNSSSDRAPAWTSANSFRDYYKNNLACSKITGLRAKKSDFSSMRLGDLVQLVSNDKATHTMIITRALGYTDAKNKWKTKTDVAICQNSTSESGRLKNYPLSKKPKNREYIHIIGSCY